MCQCGDTETAYHFFFECLLYTIYRNNLTLQIKTVFTLNMILNGDITLSSQRNIEIHTAVSKL